MLTARRGRYLGKAAELLHLGLSNRSKVDEAGLYAVLFSDGSAVLSILAEVALGCAGHYYANGIVAGRLAEYAHQGGVLAAAVAVYYAFGAAFSSRSLIKATRSSYSFL